MTPRLGSGNTADLYQTVLLAKQVYPYLTGNVHAQTSPPAAFDTQRTIVHARKLVALFEQNGIPKYVDSFTLIFLVIDSTSF